MAINLASLKAPFPLEQISWRAQSMTKDGTKAMALCYIDARDVRDRLDDVCGVAGWQSEHYDCGNGKLACKIGIKVGDEWIWKTDGAGATDVEAEKGAFSDAFKRAATNWGIGRYLYDLPSPWVACESYKNAKGNLSWKAWKENPWDKIRQPEPEPEPKVAKPPFDVEAEAKRIMGMAIEIKSLKDLNGLREIERDKVLEIKQWDKNRYNAIAKTFKDREALLKGDDDGE